MLYKATFCNCKRCRHQKSCTDLIMGDCHVFNLNGGYPLATRLDDIFAAVSDAHVAQRIQACHITGAEPVILVYGTWL